MSSTAEHYEISSRLAVGDGGLVYKATDRSSGNIVALKLLLPADQVAHPLDVEALLRDVPAISLISGPNIAQLLDAFQDDEGTILVYEFAEGMRGLDVPVTSTIHAAQAVEVAAQLLAALSCGELMQYPHGGLKPSDISLASQSDGRPFLKVLDWGLANYRTEPTPAALPYMAPERLDGSPPSHQADLFSAGAVLFYLFTGQQPVKASSRDGFAMAWRMLNPQVLHNLRPDLPSALIDLIARLLQPEPSQRPDSAAEVLTALDAVIVISPPSEPEAIHRPLRPRTNPPPVRRVAVERPASIQKKGRSAAVFVTGFILLLALGAAGYFFWQNTQADETPQLPDATVTSTQPPQKTTMQGPTNPSAAAPAGNARGTFSSCAEPPTVDPTDIANLSSQKGSDKWFFQSNAETSVADAAKGITFTTGDTPVFFKALTYKIATGCKKGATPENPTTWTVRLGTLSGNNFTQIASQQVEQIADTGEGDYITWTFATPVPLAANTTYAVDVSMLSRTTWQTGIPYLAYSGNVTTRGVGHHYNSGDRGKGGSTIAPSGNIDRIFHVDLQTP